MQKETIREKRWQWNCKISSIIIYNQLAFLYCR